MIGGLRPYPELKDTDLPWLGKVPAHWEVRRNGRLFGARRETGFPHLPILEVSIGRGVRVRDFDNGGRKQEMTDRSKYQRALQGDVAYNMMRMWQGAVGVAPTDGLVSPAYVVARPFPETNSAYYAYLFRTAAYMREIDVFSRGIVPDRNRLYWESFKQMPSVYPPLEEQRLIVRFLDWHGAQTAKFIRAKKQIITLLNEQKQAIIYRAVTRGLDPNVKLRSSGVRWLGDVPEPWGVKRLKTEVTFVGGGTPSKAETSFWNGDIPWVSPKDMKSDAVSDAQDKITAEAVEKSSTKIIPSGAILMVVRSGILQRKIPIALCNRDVAINQDMKAIISKGKIIPQYLVYYVIGCEKALLMEWTKQGATVESIEHQFLADSLIPIPSIQEQLTINQFIKSQSVEFTKSIDMTMREIALLQEFRTRLILDVVTGKLNVREAAASLPEQPDGTEPFGEPDGADELDATEGDDFELEEAAA